MNFLHTNSWRWKRSDLRYFWSDLALKEQLVQFYENERTLLNTLEGFAGSGLLDGESVIVIATGKHLNELNSRLATQGFNLNELSSEGRYVPLVASRVLDKLMNNGMPDPSSFRAEIGNIYRKASGNGTRVRAFGEMVAMLAAEDNMQAALELEALWNELAESYAFYLHCAYPSTLFVGIGDAEPLAAVCGQHSHVIPSEGRGLAGPVHGDDRFHGAAGGFRSGR